MHRLLQVAARWRILLAIFPVLLAITAIDLATTRAPRSSGSGDTTIISADSPAWTESRNREAAVLWAVGDIADCGSPGDEATASLLEATDGAIAVLGDIAYDSGTQQQFADCYGESWGGLRDRTRPTPGNHEYQTAAAAPYFDYFGAMAGDPSRGYYSYDLGAWHVIALNSNCDAVGGCDDGSAQLAWLAADLRQSNSRCTLAYWHHPLSSSGQHGNDGRMRRPYELLDTTGADVVLAGHDHDYERLAPQDASGRARADGIRQFVVGTGGKSLRGFPKALNTSEVRYSQSFGVLRLTLDTSSYRWDFITVSGEIIDSGTGVCR